MASTDFTASLLVDQTPKQAFNAIINLKAWWSEEIEGNTDKLNEVFLYHYKDIHICKMKLVELVPDKKIVWEVLENQFSFIEDQTEWKGTHLIFDIHSKDSKTQVKFTHQGLVPEYECYQVCYDGWTNYIHNSLHQLITTGKGTPNPKEGDGFNFELAEKWNLHK